MSRSLSKYKKSLILSICCIAAYASFAQKHDYNYLSRFSENSGGIQLSYTDEGDSLIIKGDYRNYSMTAGNPFSDKDGNLLFFSNGLHVYDRNAEVIENGYDMAVGGFLPDLYSRDTTVTFGIGQNWVTIPISDSLFYAFHKGAEISAYEFFDLDIEEDGHKLSIYSDGLYLTKIRMSSDGGLFINQQEKKILIVDEKLEFNQLMACKHANGEDWWIHQPKVETSDAYLIRVYADGRMEDPQLQYFSENNGRVRSNSVTKVNPKGTILARFIGLWVDDFTHKLELFHFDRCTGETDRFFVDSLTQAPNNSRVKDIEFSQSGRFLYVANSDNILQFDLEHDNFYTSRDTIAQWDEFVINNQPSFYDNLWRLPNGKIVCNTRFNVPFLHVIHNPSAKGDLCNFEARARMSPRDSIKPNSNLGITYLPYFPEYRMEPLDVDCTTNTSSPSITNIDAIVYPNPTMDEINIDLRGPVEQVEIKIFSATGELVHSQFTRDNRFTLSTYDYSEGMYFVIVNFKDNQKKFSAKFVKY